jgi:hypothetical protein
VKLIHTCATALARFGLGFPLAVWAFGSLSLAANGRVAGWQALAGGCVGMLGALWSVRGARDRAVVAVAILCSLCLALLAAHSWPDLSYDGLYYHQPATYALADGWNPLWHSDLFLQSYLQEAEVEIVSCYPKAAWVIGGSLYELTGVVNSRHALHWLLLLASAGCIWSGLRDLGVRGGRGAVATLLWCAHPVALYQATTSYLDGMVASLLSMLVVSMMCLARRPSRAWGMVSSAAAVLLIGLKFTGLVYAGAVIAVFMLGALMCRQRWRPMLWVGVSSLCIGIVFASDSYARNLVRHGNPFYPAVGKPASVMAAQASPEFMRVGRVERLARSLASVQHSDKVELIVCPAPRLPFTAWHWQRRYDPRFSGFGPLTFEIAILTFLVWLFRGAKVCTAGIAVLVSALATEAAWWARLTPQLWILPALVLLGPARSRVSEILRYVLIVLMILNVLIVVSASLRGARSDARQWDRAYAKMPAESVERYLARPACSYAVTRRLQEAGEH